MVCFVLELMKAFSCLCATLFWGSTSPFHLLIETTSGLLLDLVFALGPMCTRCLNNPDTEAEIYTIGAGGAWRSIGPPPPGDFNNLLFNNFLHGAVHWIPYGGRSTSSQVIQSFDFEREQFRPLSLPSLLAKNEFLYSLTLEVLGGNKIEFLF
ncbi:hypothetical protein PRUPE_6G217100 [Prunus persica]|uniref:F-box associated beta-propeller type 1 domain-containing protein n=1 Tax=Prunus persica TaxID=3760 RepID=A0A251NVB3_PRUPE|nr:hypothetical protein PRUPE_6G217100 [Prunus persica]